MGVVVGHLLMGLQTHPDSNTLENQFGEHWQKLLALKREVDPHNVFRTAQPDLSAAYEGHQNGIGATNGTAVI